MLVGYQLWIWASIRYVQYQEEEKEEEELQSVIPKSWRSRSRRHDILDRINQSLPSFQYYVTLLTTPSTRYLDDFQISNYKYWMKIRKIINFFRAKVLIASRKARWFADFTWQCKTQNAIVLGRQDEKDPMRINKLWLKGSIASKHTQGTGGEPRTID